MGNGIRLTVLGTRGSCPVSGTEWREFGGATSCYLLEADGQRVFLDAGTGMLRAPETAAEGNVTVLLSHTHIDHVLGLPLFGGLFRAETRVRIIGAERDGLTTAAQLARFLAPPLWPCGLDAYPARVVCEDRSGPFSLGELQVESMELPHPGGCRAFRITNRETAVVYATDFELPRDAEEELAAFARGADLLLLDGQYTREEGKLYAGYGHSTDEAALRLLRRSGAGLLRLIHHDPRSTDEILLRREAALNTPGARYAREGEVIEL